MSQFDPNSKLVKIPNVGEEQGNPIPSTPRSIPQKEKPKVIPDVPAPKEQELPSEESIRIEQKLIRLREQMATQMKEFNDLFKLKILLENKTQDDKRRETAVFEGLISQFNKSNELSPDEGTISLLILCLRHLLSLRDAGNKLAYQVYILEKEVFGEATEDKKRKEDIVNKQIKLQKLQEKLEEELKELEE